MINELCLTKDGIDAMLSFPPGTIKTNPSQEVMPYE
jgi:hypothetical protein